MAVGVACCDCCFLDHGSDFVTCMHYHALILLTQNDFVFKFAFSISFIAFSISKNI